MIASMSRAVLISVMMALCWWSVDRVSAWRDSSSLQQAINAAIVRVLSEGRFLSAELSTSFSSLSIESCSAIPDHFPFPAAPSPLSSLASTNTLADVLNSSTIRIAGIPFVAMPDGNYSATPPVGFWPSYSKLIVNELASAYNTTININYKLYPTSTAAMNALLTDDAHMTDFYWVIAGIYNNAPRRYSFVSSCSVAGYASSFFTLASSGITSATQLHQALHQGTLLPNVVVSLSQGDFNNVQPILPNTTTNIVVTTVDAMIASLQANQAAAAVLSGLPSDPSHILSVFPTTIIDPRGAMFAPPYVVTPADSLLCKDQAGNTPFHTPFHTFNQPDSAPQPSSQQQHHEQKSMAALSSSTSISSSSRSSLDDESFSPLDSTFTAFASPANYSDLAVAFNTALMNLIASNQMADLQVAAAPFRASQCYTCTPTPVSYKYPSASTATGVLASVLQTGQLLIAGAADALLVSPTEGNYAVSDPTGYYPSVMRAICTLLSAQYQRKIVPVWTQYKNVSEALNSVQLGTNYMTDLYFSVSVEYLGHLSVRQFFTPSCSAIGYTQLLVVAAWTNVTQVSQVPPLIANGLLPPKFGALSAASTENINAVIPSQYLSTSSLLISSNFADLLQGVANGTMAGAIWNLPETLPSSLSVPATQFTVLQKVVVTPKVAFFRPPVYSLCAATSPSPSLSPSPSPSPSVAAAAHVHPLSFTTSLLILCISLLLYTVGNQRA